MNKTPDRKKRFRVWVEQVNQTYVDVLATDIHHAKEKGYSLWRKEFAHSRVTDVREVLS